MKALAKAWSEDAIVLERYGHSDASIMSDHATTLRHTIAHEERRLLASDRCPRCGWTYAQSREDGCAPDDCSYRPEQNSAEYQRVKAYDEMFDGQLRQNLASAYLAFDVRKIITARHIYALRKGAVSVDYMVRHREGLPDGFGRHAIILRDLADALEALPPPGAVEAAAGAVAG